MGRRAARKTLAENRKHKALAVRCGNEIRIIRKTRKGPWMALRLVVPKDAKGLIDVRSLGSKTEADGFIVELGEKIGRADF